MNQPKAKKLCDKEKEICKKFFIFLVQYVKRACLYNHTKIINKENKNNTANYQRYLPHRNLDRNVKFPMYYKLKKKPSHRTIIGAEFYSYRIVFFCQSIFSSFAGTRQPFWANFSLSLKLGSVGPAYFYLIRILSLDPCSGHGRLASHCR